MSKKTYITPQQWGFKMETQCMLAASYFSVSLEEKQHVTLVDEEFDEDFD